MTVLDDKGRPVEVEPIPPTTGIDSWHARLAAYPGPEPFFGVDRSPAERMQLLVDLHRAGLLGPQPSRWWRVRRWLVYALARLLRIEIVDADEYD
jgi:hypothetical protein